MNVGPAFWALGASGGGGGVDPLFSNVVLLLHAEGVDASTTFTNSAGVTQTLGVGGTAEIDTAQAKFGGSSISCAGGVIRVAANATIDLTSADFCLEAHVRLASLTGAIIFDNSESGGLYNAQVWFNATAGAFGARGFNAASTLVYDMTSGAVSAGVWYHVALTRQGGTYRLFVDGALVASTVTSGAMYDTSASRLSIGAYSTGAASLNGHMDEVRVTKGAARYTSAFTPPAAPHPDS